MNEIEKSRKERLRACERVLADHMEEFVKVGLALMEIRDKRLYKEDGWSDFDKYTKEKWGWGRKHVDRIISSAELRLALPDVSEKVTPIGRHSEPEGNWTERSVRELKRLKSPTKAKAVAQRVVKEVKEKKAKGETVRLGSVVRKHVQKELNPEPKPKQESPMFSEVVFRYLGEINGMAAVIEEVRKEDLALFGRSERGLSEDFAAAIERLSRAWDVTMPAARPAREKKGDA